MKKVNIFIGDDKITTVTGGDINFKVKVTCNTNAQCPDNQAWVSSRDDGKRHINRYSAVIYQSIGNCELYYRNHGSIEFEIIREILNFYGIRSLKFYCVITSEQYRQRKKAKTPSKATILRIAVARREHDIALLQQFGLRHDMFNDHSSKGSWRSQDKKERLLYICQNRDPFASTYDGLSSVANVDLVDFASHFGVSKLCFFIVFLFWFFWVGAYYLKSTVFVQGY